MDEFYSRVPWSSDPSLKEKTHEVGVDFDRLLQLLREQKSDDEMAAELAVPVELVSHLRRHFERYGVHSIVGLD